MNFYEQYLHPMHHFNLLPLLALHFFILSKKSKYITHIKLKTSVYHYISLLRRQRGRVVRALDLQCGGSEFKSRSDRLLDLFTVVPSSNPRLLL